MIRRLSFSALAIGLVLSLSAGCGKKSTVGTVNDKCLTALGQIMGGKTTALCSHGGNIVLLVNKNDQAASAPYAQTIGAFRQSLGQSIKIIATEDIDMPATLAPGMEPFSFNQLTGMLQKYANADYLVSFVGIPQLNPEQIAQLPSPRPQVIVVIARSRPTQVMLNKKVVSLVAVPKGLSDEALADLYSARSSTAQELFDARYETVK